MTVIKPVINEYCEHKMLQILENSKDTSSITIEEAEAQCMAVLDGVGREPVPGDPIFEKYLANEMDIVARMLRAGQENVARQTYANISTFFRDEYGVQVPPFPTLEKIT